VAPKGRAWDGWAVAAAGLLVRLMVVWWAWDQFPPTADGSYYHRLAVRIAEGHGYTWLWPDGTVTSAAHYPVGYPALVASVYGAFAALPGLAMVMNALVGALGCLAVHQMLARLRHRRLALAGGLLVAFHPGLVGYTPALMTEGVSASLVACAAWAATVARGTHDTRQRWLWVSACGLVLGACTLIRPQCLVLAPIFGVAAWGVRRGFGRALMAGAVVTALTLAVCAPWTARNCDKMGRCALVSVNGGWNLLIGTDPEGQGGWAPLKTPAECREVFDEAGKDQCFERAARRRIATSPGSWLALAPKKLAVTFDYCGAAGWYLHEANRQAFGQRAKLVLGVVETLYERALLILALLALWPQTMGRGRRGLAGRALAVLLLAAIALACSRHGWLAYLALLVTPLLRRPGLFKAHPIYGATWATLVCVAVVHAVFFGAGRYQMLVLPMICALAAVGLGRTWAIARSVGRRMGR
jgi:hypothetical protein